MKTPFANHQLYRNLAMSIGFAVILLVLRVQLTDSRFYLFLIWNLFLAGIPFLITQIYLQIQKYKTSKKIGFPVFICWLLFLPNSPYIITDLVHLHNQQSHLMWLDLFLVFVFALNGLVLGLLSMLDMSKIIVAHYGKKTSSYIIFKVCLLSGFGIYLGRVLRFNSWHILTKPKTLFIKIITSMYEPNVWLVTFAFGSFLWVLFMVFESVDSKTKT